MKYRVWNKDSEPEDGETVEAHEMEEAAETFARLYDCRHADYLPEREVFVCPWPIANPLRTCKFSVTLESVPKYSAQRST
jgi:hypothetical protein